MSYPLTTYSDYSAAVVITNLSGQQIYKSVFSNPNKFDTFVRVFCRSRRSWGVILSAAIPVRTSLKDFHKDFFLPTVVNRALKINGLSKVIYVLLALVFDVVTFPMRVVTVIPRAIYNTERQPHPLYELLQLKGKLALGQEGKCILVIHEWTVLKGNKKDETFKSFELKNHHIHELTNYYLGKYLCSPSTKRDPLNIVAAPFIEEADARIVQTETMQREIRWKVIPEGNCNLEGEVTKVFYSKNSAKEKWTEVSQQTIPIQYRVFEET